MCTDIQNTSKLPAVLKAPHRALLTASIIQHLHPHLSLSIPPQWPIQQHKQPPPSQPLRLQTPDTPFSTPSNSSAVPKPLRKLQPAGLPSSKTLQVMGWTSTIFELYWAESFQRAQRMPWRNTQLRKAQDAEECWL
ncbi:hypothetical protein BJ508DRAFT_362370 [Ascobolus immersus RN42]|uniref:Uncharacterized protein n=1 Tax=Ascobolus immersus RN42 TaxID=1160509 RepID=A0A3N4I3L2_ASCIM|nr:hypothetical protein BJ508DRAFT_362370 [Ascobolus immersus RN42]